MQETKDRKFRLYNVWHNRLFDDLIAVERPENRDALVFYAVNPRYEKIYNRERGYNILYEHELPIYDPKWQERGYCQTTCMMHLYWNRETHLADLGNDDYIGFMQYDMAITDAALDSIRATIQPGSGAVPAGTTLILHELCKTFAEEASTVRGLVYPYEGSVLEDYNRHFGTNIHGEMIMNEPWARQLPMMLLHTFMIPKWMFLRMMEWMCDVVMPRLEANYKAVTDYYEAGFAERIHALFLALEMYQAPDRFVLGALPVDHRWPHYHNETEFENYKKLSA